MGEYESYPGSTFNSFGIQENGVHTVTMESVGIDADDWISLLEVPEQALPSVLVRTGKEVFAGADDQFLAIFAVCSALQHDINGS